MANEFLEPNLEPNNENLPSQEQSGGGQKEQPRMSPGEQPPDAGGLEKKLSGFINNFRRINEIKEKLGFSGQEKSKEFISANPKNVAELLRQIGPEYKKFLLKEYKPTDWGNNPNRRNIEYPFICQDSSLVIGNMLADVFGLEIGGESPNHVDLISGDYYSTVHYWLKVYIDGKPYYADAVLKQQVAYLEAAHELLEIYKKYKDSSYKKHMKARMKLLLDTLDELPDEVIFKSYDEAIKEFKELYGIREDKVANHLFKEPARPTQKTGDIVTDDIGDHRFNERLRRFERMQKTINNLKGLKALKNFKKDFIARQGS
jgi:hypothetical protein